MSANAVGLVRYWFEFEFEPEATDSPPSGVTLDGDRGAGRLLGRGAGVTGFDEADCLRLLADAVGEALPPLSWSTRNPTIDADQARSFGNVSWRGIWFPPLNLGGPTLG